ncbi:MAG: diguanylate cyclase [Deltaproteobacteria bacterium]
MSHNKKKEEQDLDSQDKTQIVAPKHKNEGANQALDPCLTQLSGSGSGQVFNLRNKTYKIGRDRDCDIWVDDPHISRVHAVITDENNETIIKDNLSTNGVFINGKKVTEQILKNGDRLLIGTRLYFKFSHEFADYQEVQNQKFEQANQDGLTKLYNKRFFIDSISREFSYSKRNKNPLSLLMIDIDFFKQINDEFGHLVGDQVLSSLGKLIKDGLRHENIACRYGGEEFSIILRNTGPIAAEKVAQRIREAVEKLEFNYLNKKFHVTVSIGIATYDHQNYETYEELIKHADELLYESKLRGRNCITIKKAA